LSRVQPFRRTIADGGSHVFEVLRVTSPLMRRRCCNESPLVWYGVQRSCWLNCWSELVKAPIPFLWLRFSLAQTLFQHRRATLQAGEVANRMLPTMIHQFIARKGARKIAGLGAAIHQPAQALHPGAQSSASRPSAPLRINNRQDHGAIR
jgi:hypothetical protein